MCGVGGVLMKRALEESDASAARMAGLLARRLQHRGYEGVGMCVFGNGPQPSVHMRHDMGVVRDVLPPDVCSSMPGPVAVFQTRYSTSGKKNDSNPQRNLGPFFAETEIGPVALAHNGNLEGAEATREQLMKKGGILQSDTDSELALHEIVRAKGITFRERLHAGISNIPLAYSFVIGRPEGLYAVRDPSGVRPLFMGENEEAYLVASEDGAIRSVGGTVLGEVENGTITVLSSAGVSVFRFVPKTPKRLCLMEYAYFMRQDTQGAYLARIAAGRLLARNYPVPSHSSAPVVVVGTPESGLIAAEGYACEAGLPQRIGLVRDNIELRAFMAPTDEERKITLALKLAAIPDAVKDAVVINVDDSNVRGHTSHRIARLLYEAGAKEVHIRYATPKIVAPCIRGLDYPTAEELFAHHCPTEAAMAAKFGVHSVAYLTIDESRLAYSEGTGQEDFCTECFGGKRLLIQ